MVVQKKQSESRSRTVKVTTTGQAAVRINIAISEPQTTFRAINELSYLITRAHWDSIFRNLITCILKSALCFIVDNDSPGMCVMKCDHPGSRILDSIRQHMGHQSQH